MNKTDIISQHMSELGKKSAESRKKKYGAEFMSEIGKKGVIARKEKRQKEI